VEEEVTVRERKRYKYPLGPNGQLSAALSLSRYGTAAPARTTKVKN
jgi:hypothetical protein